MTALYGDYQALYGIDFTLARREVVAVVGANKAGKSTIMNFVMRVLWVARDMVRQAVKPMGGGAPHQMVQAGVTIDHAVRSEERTSMRVDDLFPILVEKWRISVQSLSGGLQQMVSFGRALLNQRTCCCATKSALVWPLR